MSKKLLFWVLMLLWLVLALAVTWGSGLQGYRVYGPNLLLFCIIGTLGWQVFGRPIE